MASRGQPTKYDPAYCEAIREFCKDGASISSFAASIDVCRDTITNWGNEHPEFFASVKVAKAKVAAWYDVQARNVAKNGGGNATICIFGLKNFDGEDFRDVQETKHSGGIELTGLDVVVKR